MINLGTAYSAIEVRLDRMEKQLSEAERKFASTGKRIDEQAKKTKAQLSQTFGELGRTLTIGLTAPLAALGTAAVKAAVDMDSLKRGLRTVAGSAQETERQLVRLKEVAKLPGLGFREAIEGSTRLQAAGLSARQAERALMGFGNALASVGRGKADLDGVITALSQIQSKGVISAEEINQIAERVPQIRRLMQDAFGTANTEMLQKAKLSSTEFIDAITASLEKLPKVTDGAKNAFENFGDAANRALDAIGKTLLPMVTRALEAIIPVLENIAENFGKLPDAAKMGLGGLAVGGAIIGPALYGLSMLLNAIKTVDTAFKGTALARFLGIGGGTVAAAAAGALTLQHVFSQPIPEDTVRHQNDQTRRTALENAKKLGPAQYAMVKRMFEEQDRGGGTRSPISPAEHAAEMSRRSGLLRTLPSGAGGGRIDAAARAAAAQKAKEDAEQAKRIAEERAEVMRQLAVDRAALTDKFKSQRIQAFQQFMERQGKFGPGEAASGPYKVRLAEIERDEKAERKTLAEAHQRKVDQLKRQVEAEAKDVSAAYKKSREKVEHEAKQALDEVITRANDQAFLFKAEKDNQERRAKNLTAYWLGIFNRAREMAADQLSSFNLRGAPLGESVPNQVVYEPRNSLSGNIDTEAAVVRNSADAMRKHDMQRINQNIDRAKERLEQSFGGMLGREVAYEFVDGFARSLDKAFGSSSIGKIFARALTRFMDNFVQGVVDRTLGGLAGKIGGGKGFSLGSLLGPIGGLLGFAEGGRVPGPIGAPQPAIVHGGEFVVSRKMQEQGMMGTVNVNLGGVTIANDYDVDRLVDRISQQAKRRLAVNPGTF